MRGLERPSRLTGGRTLVALVVVFELLLIVAVLDGRSGTALAASHDIPLGRVAAARQVLAEATKQEATLPADRRFATLVIARYRARAGEVDEALRTLRAATGVPSGQLWEIVPDIAAGQARRGDLPGALATTATSLSGHAADNALVVIAFVVASTGRAADAVAVLKRASDASARDRVLAAAAMGLIEFGDRAAALATLRSISTPAGSHARLVEAFLEAREGNLGKAQALAVGSVDDKWLWGLVARAHAQARAGDLAAAAATVGLIPPGDIRNAAEAAIPLGQARRGDIAGALIAAARLSDTSGLRSVLYTDIAPVQAERGDVTGALTTANLVRIQGNKDAALHGVAHAAARSGDVTAGLRIARSISSEDRRGRAVEAVMSEAAEAGHMTAALAAISGVDAGERPRMEFLIAMGRARAGDASLVLKALAGATPPEDTVLVLLAVAADLLRTPADRGDKPAFWEYDVHPFHE